MGQRDQDNLDITLAYVLQDVIADSEIPAEKGIIRHDEGVDLMPANIELSALEMLDQLGWARAMNSIRQRAEEIILS